MESFNNSPLQGIIINSVLRDMAIQNKRPMLRRRSHGLLIKIKGTTEYCFPDKSVLISANQILFVEKDSSYHVEGKNPGFSYVVNFTAPPEAIQALRDNPVFTVPDAALHAEKLYHLWEKDNVYGALACLYTLLEKSTNRYDGYLSVRDKKMLLPVEAYLSEHLTDPDFAANTLSSLCDVSDVYLRRIFKKKYGVSPSAYAVRERIRIACRLLTDGNDRPISAVSKEVGYLDPLYFSRIFKKQTGMSPSEYRQEHQDDLF